MPTILVADDNSNIHKMVELALKDLGYKIEKVGNGEHAVRKLPDIKPDLILADIFMPVRNGYEVCEFVKTNEQYQHIPVVLLQGKFDPLDEHLMKKVKADGLLMKPFVPPDPLVKMVQTLLEEAAATRATVAAVKAAPGATPESTVELTKAEIEALTGKKEEPPPEPEVHDYATAKPQIEFGAGEQPLAFGDLMGAPAEAEQAPATVEPEGFRASSLDAVEVEHPAEEAIEEKPSWGGIEEELKKPSPDEPPIKVEFGPPEEIELVTDETPAGPTTVAPIPQEELATADEFLAAGPPKIAISEVAEESWTAAAVPGAALPLEETAPSPPEVIPPPPPEPSPEPMLEAKLEPEPVLEAELGPVPEPPTPEAVAPPQAYQTPRLEEIPAPAPQMDQMPAAAAPAPAVEPPPPPPPPPVVPAVQQAAESAARSFAVSAPVDPALVDAIVEKVLARLQPQIVEQMTREVLRPLAEAILKKEQEK